MSPISRRHLVAAAAAMLVATPMALAEPPKGGHGEPAKEGGHGGEGEPDNPSEKEISRSIDLQGLVFPVFDEKGKLKNYIFVSARMLAGPGKDIWKFREQQHFIRDAIVRAAHRTSFNVKGNISKLDEKVAGDECLRVANEVVGDKAGLVTMTFTQIASQIDGK
jgi:hypothetical protein